MWKFPWFLYRFSKPVVWVFVVTLGFFFFTVDRYSLLDVCLISFGFLLFVFLSQFPSEVLLLWKTSLKKGEIRGEPNYIFVLLTFSLAGFFGTVFMFRSQILPVSGEFIRALLVVETVAALTIASVAVVHWLLILADRLMSGQSEQ